MYVNKSIFWFIQFVWWDRNIRFIYIVFEEHNTDDEIPRRISLQDYNWQNQFFVTLLAILRGSVTRLQLVAAPYSLITSVRSLGTIGTLLASACISCFDQKDKVCYSPQHFRKHFILLLTMNIIWPTSAINNIKIAVITIDIVKEKELIKRD